VTRDPGLAGTSPPISCDWHAASNAICFAPGAVVFVSLAGKTIRMSCAAHAAPFRRRISVPFVEQTPAEWWAMPEFAEEGAA
jgi:hypothetical protein